MLQTFEILVAMRTQDEVAEVEASLEALGYTVYPATTGKRSLFEIEVAEMMSEKIHLVVTNAYLEDMECIELIKAIRGGKNLLASSSDVPIIIWSDDSSELEGAAQNAGVTAIVKKHLGHEALIAKIKELLGEPSSS